MTKITFILLFLAPLFGMTQHYVGQKKSYILTQFVYDTEVTKMNLTRDTLRGVDVEILSYYFKNKTYYYYINPITRICEYYAALFNSATAKDSLIKIFDTKYKRVPHPMDETAIAWLEYDDGINYRYIVRDFNPPACLVVLGIIKNVED